MERTFVGIKPHSIEKYILMIKDLEIGIGDRGIKEYARYIDKVPEKVWNEFYAPHKKKFPFWDELMEIDFNDKPFFLAIYRGKNIIKIVGDLKGPTQVPEAPLNTIRGKYGRELMKEKGIIRLSDGEEIYRNGIHSTGGKPGEFNREAMAFRDYLPSKFFI